jgi:20S proteasome alpha/beta subunit
MFSGATPRCCDHDPQRAPYLRKKTVTIIVAVVCKDGIVMVSDSQTTRDNYRDLRTEKLHEIKFANGSALFGMAGCHEYGLAMTETLQKEAENTEILTGDTVARVFELSARKLRDRIMHNLNCTDMKQFQEQSERADFLIGHYFENKFLVHTVTLSMGVTIDDHKSVRAIGAASSMAFFLFNELTDRDLMREPMKRDVAMIFAIYAVNEIKKCDANCGGPTNAGFVTAGFLDLQTQNQVEPVTAPIQPRSCVHLLSRENIDKVSQIVWEVENETRKARREKWNELVVNTTEKIHGKWDDLFRS